MIAELPLNFTQDDLRNTINGIVRAINERERKRMNLEAMVRAYDKVCERVGEAGINETVVRRLEEFTA